MKPVTMDRILNLCAPHLNDNDMAWMANYCAQRVTKTELAQDAVLRARGEMAFDGGLPGAVRYGQPGAALSPTEAKALSGKLPRRVLHSVETAADIATTFPNMGRL